MYQRKSNLHNLILMLFDCLVIVICFVLANWIRNGNAFTSDNIRMNFRLLIAAGIISFLMLSLFKQLYKNILIRGFLEEILQILGTNLFIFAGAAIILYFIGILDAYSRWVFIYFLFLDSIGMLALHFLWKKYLPKIYKTIGRARRILLVAEEKNADSIVKEFLEQRDFHYEVIGIVLADRVDLRAIDSIPVVTTYDNLVSYCQTASIDEVLVSVEQRCDVGILGKLNDLSDMGITLHYQVDMPRMRGAKERQLTKFGELYTVTYADRFLPLGQLLLKRGMDIIGAVVGCIILIVLTLILTPIIKLESPGPIFFVQNRVGRNGRIFRMYKFRSMYVDAEERKKELMAQNEMHGLMFKMEKDPRITKVGAFLRKTSLDEFPQFINILLGDMSLVGTRPPTVDEFEQYSPYHKKRLSFRPGLTGMWQVSGRSDITDFEEIVRLDVEYIEKWSIKLDIKILWKTMLAVLKHEGAR